MNGTSSRAFAAVIVLAVLLAWSGAGRGPFVFDDHEAIVNNPTIRDWGSLHWLFPPATAGETVSGRPVLNFTFALNHALGGLDPRSYHLVNLGIHALAALLVFGVVRRTFLRHPPAGDITSADTLAAAAALLWAVHPLQTAAVTYVAQRAESLAGLWFLASLYGFIRAGEPGASRARWGTVSVLACLLGVGTKETIVVLPFVAAIWDRAFAAGSWREVWNRNGQLLLLLATCWLPLAGLVLAHDGRGASAGWATTVTPWSYLITQAAAIPHYLRLMVWPTALVFDYGTPVVGGFTEVWGRMLVLALAFGFFVWAIWRGRWWGFLGLAFFAMLAPSSSLVPVATQTMAEHRVYLALLPVIVALLVGVHRLIRRWPLALRVTLIAALVGVLGTATWQRNRTYQSARALWQDTADRRPDNARAFNNLGQALALEGQPAAAIAAYNRALALAPDHAFAHGNLGALLLAAGRLAEALAHLTRAVALDPAFTNARFNLADGLARQGRRDEAILHLRTLLAQDATALDARLKLAGLLPPEEVEAALREAEKHSPGSADVAYALGSYHVQRRNLSAALQAFALAVERDPSHWEALTNLGNCLLMAGRPTEAIARYEAVLRLRPDDRQVRENLALARELQRKP
ncbi:lipoprotein NlpI [Lacunisphaera limnophila]|uniref:Lipoprotein NlpI n=1 Tax=Lacunisphaera limnophila TaxID=1838286 RepID=A0A1D8AZX8_9BACT|nr:tetratricopeptide repeat protein [Lacunisphaera limnophila]AOS46443.1 lipoprotein NlpI [Lacunisphaera limnophila]